MRQRFFTLGRLGLHANAFSNSGRFTTMSLARYSPGECGSVMVFTRRFAGGSARCEFPTKNHRSGVRPSRFSGCMPFVWSFHAIRARNNPPRSAMSSPSVSLLLRDAFRPGANPGSSRKHRKAALARRGASGIGHGYRSAGGPRWYGCSDVPRSLHDGSR